MDSTRQGQKNAGQSCNFFAQNFGRLLFFFKKSPNLEVRAEKNHNSCAIFFGLMEDTILPSMRLPVIEITAGGLSWLAQQRKLMSTWREQENYYLVLDRYISPSEIEKIIESTFKPKYHWGIFCPILKKILQIQQKAVLGGVLSSIKYHLKYLIVIAHDCLLFWIFRRIERFIDLWFVFGQAQCLKWDFLWHP